MADPEQDTAAIARGIAWQIAASHRLRAKFLENANEAVAEAVPGKRPFGLTVHPETKKLREQVLAAIPDIMGRGEAASSAHAEAVMRQFFQAAIRNPELSFMSILGLSILTFVVGVALVVTGIVTAFVGDDNTRNTIIASVFGGGGVVSALGSVYTLARRGVSIANADHAQIRLILSGFATELGHLRALPLKNLKQVEEVNGRIRDAMTHAVDVIQTRVKVEPTSGEPTPAGQPGAPSGQKQGESEGPS